ncbi:hypothetical protein CEXT_65831 [Caerostris extrusa]|uniref:Uncharacterized protein n=1 Tax=Caerostris extrusa TaxID=172846 RepID=A0AAV4VYL1_CAEEX|nr:hypothetical protein CEXT_65831 [Caerostris extrusa]
MKKLFRSIFTFSYLPKTHAKSEVDEENIERVPSALNGSESKDLIQIIQLYHAHFHDDLDCKIKDNLNSNEKISKSINDFSISDIYLKENVRNHRYRKFSPIPEETEEDLAREEETAESPAFDVKVSG